MAETCWAGGRGALRLRTAPPRGQGGAQSGLGIRGSRCRWGKDPLFFSGLNTRGSERLSGARMGSSGLEPAPPERQEQQGQAVALEVAFPGLRGGRAGHACSLTACRGRSRAEAHREPDAAGSGPLPARGGSPRAEWTGSGSRTDVSSVIELCALDHRIIFFLCV